MVVDFLRMSSLETMRMVEGSDETTTVRWYRALPGAKALPFLHAFGSHVWDDARMRLNPALGQQQGPREWAPTNYAFAPAGDHFHGKEEWFKRGLPASELVTPTTDPDPACEPPMLNVRYTDDSLIISDVVELDIDPERGLTLSDDLGAGIAHLGTRTAGLDLPGIIDDVDQKLGHGIKGLERGWIGSVPLSFPSLGAWLSGEAAKVGGFLTLYGPVSGETSAKLTCVIGVFGGGSSQYLWSAQLAGIGDYARCYATNGFPIEADNALTFSFHADMSGSPLRSTVLRLTNAGLDISGTNAAGAPRNVDLTVNGAPISGGAAALLFSGYRGP